MKVAVALIVSVVVVGCAAEPTDPVSSTDTSLTKRETNQIFATQWGPTQFNAVAGAPDGYDDCAPTSLLMGAAFLGYVPAPNAADAETGIRYMRDLTRGEPTPLSSVTSIAMIMRGLSALEANAHIDTVDIGTINAVLDAGGIVLIGGDPKHAWGLHLDARQDYLHHYSDSPDDVFGHEVAVVGYSSTGRNDVIADPLSTIGAIDVTAAQIETFWADMEPLDGIAPTAIEMHAPGR